MSTSANHLTLASVLAVVVLTLVGGSVTTRSEQPDKKGDPAALRPFQKALCIENGISGCGADLGHQFTVPIASSDGRAVVRLVVEYVSGGCALGLGGVQTGMRLQTVADGATVSHSFIPIATASGQSNVAQATRIYADPGSVLTFTVGVLNTPSSQCRMQLSGHFAVD